MTNLLERMWRSTETTMTWWYHTSQAPSETPVTDVETANLTTKPTLTTTTNHIVTRDSRVWRAWRPRPIRSRASAVVQWELETSQMKPIEEVRTVKRRCCITISAESSGINWRVRTVSQRKVLLLVTTLGWILLILVKATSWVLSSVGLLCLFFFVFFCSCCVCGRAWVLLLKKLRSLTKIKRNFDYKLLREHLR